MRLVTKGACGVNLFPDYWSQRAALEIPSLVLNVVALFVSAFLSWKLLKARITRLFLAAILSCDQRQSFGWQTFKRVGASRAISRFYDVVLVLSIVIQLSLFFIIVSASLWLDQILNGNIAHLTTRRTAFEVAMAFVIIVSASTIGISTNSTHQIL